MAINLGITMSASFFERHMTVKQLKKCINLLLDTDEIYPNTVGNLAVTRDNTMLGYIDFNDETFTNADSSL